MASIILAGIGGSLFGGMTSSVLGAAVGKMAGSVVGSMIDQTLFSNKSSHYTENNRLDDLRIQSSSYGRVIPIVYGVVKISGNIIWADKIKERRSNTQTTHRTGKSSSVTHTHTEYSYTISFAVAVCKGPITAIERIWADDIIIDKQSKSIRIYNGNENQLPDPLIESIEGVDYTPAYRDLAYVVFENFDLTQFGNHLPNLEFEVRKTLTNDNSVENMIQGITIIPGGGEFVYDTILQMKSNGSYINDDNDEKRFITYGHKEKINCHTDINQANSLISLDQLKTTLPNVKWAAPVVTWFANSKNINCDIEPGVEYTDGGVTEPDTWSVRDYNRQNAQKILYENGRPIYGGTINDASIIRYVKELRNRGYKIMFYPMFFINTHNKPWRGYMSGNVYDIKRFFNHKKGYNAFILHYAQLVRGYVDAFLIGSELETITKMHKDNNYIAVNELILLAKQVKKILGPTVKISYAANWSEYHHTQEGWYHLDPLWASEYIDFVGIDSYFPLTDWQEQSYDVDEVIKGWTKGEGYDYHYIDKTRSKKVPLNKKYAWKNIEWWWKNDHYNPNGQKTNWTPKSKKIWFTEYGFSSVQLATNQPNVFLYYDENEVEFGLPYNSNGEVDITAQRIGIEATERKWANSEMIENKFLWTWDARPYPTWPDRFDYWSDGKSWLKGHWVQGKLGAITLGALLKELSSYAGLGEAEIDISKISDIVEGLVINDNISLKQIIENLQQSYFFDVSEVNCKIHFIERATKNTKNIYYHDLIPYNNEYNKHNTHNISSDLLSIKTLQEVDLPSKVDVNFINRPSGYIIGNQHARRMNSISNIQLIYNLPLIMDNSRANILANTILYNAWTEKYQYTFILPIKYAYLSPADLISIKTDSCIHKIRITSVEFGKNYQIKICGVAEDVNLYKKWQPTLKIIENENDNNNNNNNIKTLYNKERNFDKNQSRPIDNALTITEFEIVDIPRIDLIEDIFNKTNIVNDYDDNQYINLYNKQNDNDKKIKNRIIIATCGYSEKWYGCELSFVENLNNDTNDNNAKNKKYASKNNIAHKSIISGLHRAIIGKTLTVLNPPKSPYLIDRHNEIIINLIEGQLNNITLDDLFDGKNLMIINNELIQFKTVTLINTNQYKISGLLRGLFGTGKFNTNDNYTYNITHNYLHPIGSRIILVNNDLYSADIPYELCDKKNITVIAKTLNQNGNAIEEKGMINKKNINMVFNYCKPLPPTHTNIEKIHDNQIKITWRGQTLDINQESLDFKIVIKTKIQDDTCGKDPVKDPNEIQNKINHIQNIYLTNQYSYILNNVKLENITNIRIYCVTSGGIESDIVDVKLKA